MTVPAMPLVGMRRSLAGSMIGGIAETQEMLDFCAAHDVPPEIEVIEPDYINEAYERVLASDVRYRFVIDTGSLTSRLGRSSSMPASGQPAAASARRRDGCSRGRHRDGSRRR